MIKVFDHKQQQIGWSWYCSWCHDCGPVKNDEESAVTEYLAHQTTQECVDAEKRHDMVTAEVGKISALYLDMLPQQSHS